MNLSRKQVLGIVALLILLTTSSVVFAVLYMTKNVTITGGVSAAGSIEVYEEDGVTPMTSFNFENFTAGVEETKSKDFFINNTSTVPVYVYWNITGSSFDWNAQQSGYVNATKGYGLWLYTDQTSNWAPNDSSLPEALYLNAGEGEQVRIYISISTTTTIPELYSLDMGFYAEDA